MTAPDIIARLVEQFDRNRDDYRSGRYNETQLRREFLDPFFDALGWDVSNRSGHADAYKDVIHEDAIKIGSATKAPDYCFRIGRERKFFLEAKKPAILTVRWVGFKVIVVEIEDSFILIRKMILISDTSRKVSSKDLLVSLC